MAEEKEKQEKQEPAAPEEKEKSPTGDDSPQALRQALDQAKAKAEEYLDQWRRERAEFSNYKKRSEKEKEELVKLANALLVAKILPILDDFDRAAATLPYELREMTWLDGVFLIQRKLQLALEQEGLVPFGEVGDKFDPNLHEAVSHDEGTGHKDEHISAILQKGYRLGDRVLRPAMV
ncbi:MAG: nucleotide exchange factor GrpE, partial [Chloroflexi bacterium]|nr:nucleotide exchange factor GrpE [Chloroflexota bacterium]